MGADGILSGLVILLAFGGLLSLPIAFVAGLNLRARALRPISDRQDFSRPTQYQVVDLLALLAQLSLVAACWSAISVRNKSSGEEVVILVFVIAGVLVAGCWWHAVELASRANIHRLPQRLTTVWILVPLTLVCGIGLILHAILGFFIAIALFRGFSLVGLIALLCVAGGMVLLLAALAGCRRMAQWAVKE